MKKISESSLLRKAMGSRKEMSKRRVCLSGINAILKIMPEPIHPPEAYMLLITRIHGILRIFSFEHGFDQTCFLCRWCNYNGLFSHMNFGLRAYSSEDEFLHEVGEIICELVLQEPKRHIWGNI